MAARDKPSTLAKRGPARWARYGRKVATRGLAGTWQVVALLGGWGVLVVLASIAVWFSHADWPLIAAAVLLGLFVITAIGGYRLWDAADRATEQAQRELVEARRVAEGLGGGRPSAVAVHGSKRVEIGRIETDVSSALSLTDSEDVAAGEVTSRSQPGDQPLSLTEIRDRRFGPAERVILDGHAFIRCAFDGCVLVHSGGGFDLHECHVSRAVSTNLLGPAGTVTMLLDAIGALKDRPSALPPGGEA